MTQKVRSVTRNENGYTVITYWDGSQQTLYETKDLNYVIGEVETLRGEFDDLREDIPEDYTELISDVNELKQDFTHIQSAMVTDTASGSIASFTDGADGVPMSSVVVTIEPVQSDSGDPSPTNVRPISGWTQVQTTVCGKNLVGVTGETNVSTTHATEKFASAFAGVKWKPNTQYVLSIDSQALEASSSSKIWYARFMYSDGSVDGYGEHAINNNSVSSGQTMTRYIIASDASKSVVGVSFTQGTSYNIAYKDVQLEEGSATAYEPYNGTTHTTALGQTVYGGTLDVVSGVLTIDRQIVTNEELISATGWTAAGHGCFVAPSAYSLPSNADATYVNPKLIATALPTGSQSNVYNNSVLGIAQWWGNKIGIGTGDADMSTVADFKTWFAENGSDIVYPLATPTTVQLTAQEVDSLLGDNNVFADAGSVSVTYTADLKKYIAKVVANA